MKLISENTESTVVARFERKATKRVTYQSEAQLEDALIAQLQSQGYEFLDIHTEEELIANLRKQIERLNHIQFTENEWKGFFGPKIANTGSGIAEKTDLLQSDRTAQLLLWRDDNTMQNIMLLDKRYIHENHLQVIRQYTPTDGKHKTRYDVTILVNGLPMVHIELKRRGVAIKEAFNQINRYERDSFWADNGLFDYIQLFVISNGTETKYYSNTTRRQHVDMKKGRQVNHQVQTSNSFEFTSYWADRENNIIPDLEDFTSTFFQKNTLLQVLIRYCVFTANRNLLVMRPYQISATEAILQQILIASNKRLYGSLDAGGYIWHTTGSGKTLTSFKTAQLCTRLFDDIEKVLFVVDRKDLDYQTVREYDRFQKDCVSSNTSTAKLKQQISNTDPTKKIVITTIQKLTQFCKSEQDHPIFDKQVVIIFDECHRSQFGEMRKTIVHRFKKWYIFGFTGTPIFPQNAGNQLATTEQLFGKRLHTYTVINAIADHNVLPFRVEYIKTIGTKNAIPDEQVRGIDAERALMDSQRVHNIVEYTLAHFDQKTKRNDCYKLEERRVSGFNSIFACASIPAAIQYYREFQRQMADMNPDERLKIALIYSFGANEEELDNSGLLDEENSDSIEGLDASSRDALDSAIRDYNEIFSTNFSTDSSRFPNYYKDISERMKKRELDMLVVVNMFLTGFDATTLNTLWVDKNLRLHGLMQAYSRTNRILNSIKTFGNIVCFRNLEKETNDAIALFGDKDANGLVLLKTYEEYLNGFTDEKGNIKPGFKELVAVLEAQYPLSTDIRLMGEQTERDFIHIFGAYLKLRNILTTFDRFAEDKDTIISPSAEQDYTSRYLDLREKYRKHTEGEVADINDDLVFEIELIKQVEINIDYILALIEKKKALNDPNDPKDLKDPLEDLINKAIGSSPALRNKRQLIEEFISRYSTSADIMGQWQKYIREQAKTQLEAIITDEKLNHDKTIAFMRRAFQIGEIEENGTAISDCLPRLPLFGEAGSSRAETKQRVIDRFHDYYDRFHDIYEFDM